MSDLEPAGGLGAFIANLYSCSMFDRFRSRSIARALLLGAALLGCTPDSTEPTTARSASTAPPSATTTAPTSAPTASANRFLPSLEDEQARSLLEPVEVRDRKDPRIGHLIGLFLERAWCMRGIAGELPAGDPRIARLDHAARVHASEAVRQMSDSGYGGEHWLASFAVYLLTDVQPASR